MAHPTDEREFINFETLTWATSVAETPTAHLDLNFFNGDLESCGNAFEDGDERLPVRFTSSQQTKHAARLPVAGKEFGFRRCTHHRHVRRDPGPRFTLQRRLMHEHPKPINRCCARRHCGS